MDGINYLKIYTFFHDMIFDNLFSLSTVIVTSRPNCSGAIVDIVQDSQAHYRILGFSPEKVTEYVNKYFSDDKNNSKSLLSFLKERENLR